MFHPGRPPRSPSDDFKGLVVACTVRAMAILSIVKGGWPAVAPFALAGLVTLGVVVYLRWLVRPLP